MLVHYLLDGYNITNQVPRLAGPTLEDSRRRLLTWLDTACPHGVHNGVTVVFDGRSEYFGLPPAAGAKVVFTCNESADDFIKRQVEEAADPRKFVVVSDDKGIKLYARALGAGVLSVKEFTADLGGGKAGKSKSAAHHGGKHISLTQAQKINKELGKIWGIDHAS